VAFEEALPHFRGRGFVAGNPVRPAFFDAAPREHGPDSPAPRLLVLGGSQGAHAINDAVVRAATALYRRLPGLVLVHQTGARDLATVRERYAAAGVGARAEAFIDGVADEMAAADLVLSRAGATTLAELAASGRPALLVPFPGATDDHQRRNAQALEAEGAAVVIDEHDLTPDRLVEGILSTLADAPRRQAMSAAMRRLARPDAAARIVDRLVALAGAGADRVA
jgi:UDP-N-acetylglucosamine--N-acetylmuramyl-(pentapeptide) pyrophosphoryl-undecaprenol N-acetylglucosamine transferase